MNLTVLYKKYRRLRYFAIVVIVSILGLIGYGNCTSITTPTYTFTGTISGEFANTVRVSWSIPIYQSVNFDTSNLYIYIDKFSVNGNELYFDSFDSSELLSLYRVYPIVSSQFYSNSLWNDYQNVYFTGTTLDLGSNSNLKKYYNLIGITFQLRNNGYDCSTNPCQVEAKIHFVLNDDYYVSGIYNGLIDTLNTCQSNLSSLQSSLNSCQSDLNSCQSNSSDCSDTESLLQSCSSDLQTCNSNLNSCINGSFSGSSRSALFINNIQHLGAPIINIDIPEEFEWNYNYGSGEQIETINIDIEGYGYDQEKMQKMVNTQFAEMNNEDLSNLISKIADFIPLLLIAGIFIRIRYIIKKRIFRK